MRRRLLVWIGVAALLLPGGAGASVATDLAAAISLETDAQAHLSDSSRVRADLRSALLRLQRARGGALKPDIDQLIATAIGFVNQGLGSSSSTRVSIAVQSALVDTRYALVSVQQVAARPLGCIATLVDSSSMLGRSQVSLSACSVALTSITFDFPRQLTRYTEIAVVSPLVAGGVVSTRCAKPLPRRLRCAVVFPKGATGVIRFLPHVKLGGKVTLTFVVAGKSYVLPATAT